MSSNPNTKTEQDDAFDKFQELARKLLAVPKKELGKTKKKAKRKKQAKRTSSQ